MPELPEVETIRIQLNQTLKGLRIKDVEVLKAKSFQGNKKEVIGKKVVGVGRRAKIILIQLSGGYCLAIHLKMTGQLIFRDKEPRYKEVKSERNGPFVVGELPNKYTRVIIDFSNSSRLFFNDLRIFGWVRVCEIENGEWEIDNLKSLGPEANDEKKFTLEYLKQILSRSKKPVKLVIMDQEKLAGVGNIYANEVLFAARIDPQRPANSLKEDEIRKLRDSILRVLKSAIVHKGTSDKDEAYRQISGEKGDFQNYLQVYGRDKQKCPKCSGEIKRVKIGGRGTFFCPNCQK